AVLLRESRSHPFGGVRTVSLVAFHEDRAFIDALLLHVRHTGGGLQFSRMPAGRLFRRTRHEICYNCTVPLRRRLVVCTEATCLRAESAQHLSLGAHVGAV